MGQNFPAKESCFSMFYQNNNKRVILTCLCPTANTQKMKNKLQKFPPHLNTGENINTLGSFLSLSCLSKPSLSLIRKPFLAPDVRHSFPFAFEFLFFPFARIGLGLGTLHRFLNHVDNHWSPHPLSPFHFSGHWYQTQSTLIKLFMLKSPNIHYWSYPLLKLLHCKGINSPMRGLRGEAERRVQDCSQ